MKPVYVINGFLESGKTNLSVLRWHSPISKSREKRSWLYVKREKKSTMRLFWKRAVPSWSWLRRRLILRRENLTALEKKHKPERIIIEYNGMWNYKNAKLPWWLEDWAADYNHRRFHLPDVYTNMRSLLAEMIRKSEMIIINRCDTVKDQLNTYKRNIKAVNASADVIFEDANGEIDEILEEDLPYDLKQDVIVLDNEGYGIWYLDAMDHLERYVGKKLQFVAMVLKPENFPKGYFVPGRMAMTCCAEDMAFLGYACQYEGADSLKQKEWVKVTATVAREYWEDYKGEGPILHAISVEKTKAPKEEVISFS